MKAALGLLVAAQLLGMPAAVDMTNYEEPEVTVEYASEGDKEPTRQEHFMWFYRVHEGKEQMRLWSLTYQYWVTDWIDCD